MCAQLEKAGLKIKLNEMGGLSQLANKKKPLIWYAERRPSLQEVSKKILETVSELKQKFRKLLNANTPLFPLLQLSHYVHYFVRNCSPFPTPLSCTSVAAPFGEELVLDRGESAIVCRQN